MMQIFLSASRLRGVEIVSVERTRKVYVLCSAVVWPGVQRVGREVLLCGLELWAGKEQLLRESSIERSLKAAGGSACWCLGLLPAR